MFQGKSKRYWANHLEGQFELEKAGIRIALEFVKSACCVPHVVFPDVFNQFIAGNSACTFQAFQQERLAIGKVITSPDVNKGNRRANIFIEFFVIIVDPKNWTTS